ncbi:MULTISPECIES: TetR/AcrR family transcriptional regulator [unclassified Pseudoalteromonas]|uniref:TetR/AcrR family transcriptional regulator n=1 Tax=unclassified Pseudoalteromonas TaxID=194690 RepID=UPI000C08B42E|nr:MULTISPECIES: TetR/AcrR family transcriptional regulator [unclassified Pseudoalteromonas]MDP2635394.1 TetR/AcrR family transcriptional regulator [Pseudoalteromonas sp. 1_MG-2023]PHN89826.1 TetR family transcriptional regulator [Pseudoalteromonas sp. 3D05]
MDKRTQIVNTALALFYNKGIHAVGINEVIQAAKVAKKTLYNHFSSKDELICACLVVRDERFNRWLKAQLIYAKTPFEVADALFNALSLWINNQVDELGNFNGCFFINTAAEFPLETDPIARLCSKHKQTVLKIIYDALILTTQLKESPAEAEQLSKLLMTLKEGIICQARVSKQPQTLLLDKTILKKLIA